MKTFNFRVHSQKTLGSKIEKLKKSGGQIF